MTDKTGGSAFPTSAFPMYKASGSGETFELEKVECPGMTLRDYFAAKVMQALIQVRPDNSLVMQDIMAKNAYLMACAMLKEREK